MVVPAPVTAEVDHLLRRHGGPQAARRFLEDLVEARFDVPTLSRDEYEMALATHNKYADLDLGLADLSVVVLAYRYRTRRLLTFDDRHFRTVEPLQGGTFSLFPADA